MKRIRVIRVGFVLVVLTSLFSVAVHAQGFHYGPMVELSINSSDVRSEHFSRPQIGCNMVEWCVMSFKSITEMRFFSKAD